MKKPTSQKDFQGSVETANDSWAELRDAASYPEIITVIDDLFDVDDHLREAATEGFFEALLARLNKVDLDTEEQINLLSAVADKASCPHDLYNAVVDEANRLIDEDEADRPSPILQDGHGYHPR